MVSFNEAYKEWRNHARKYHRESVIHAAIELLNQPTANRLEEIRRAPWQVMLIVKWVCQDKSTDHNTGKRISSAEFDELRQMLWEFPERIGSGVRDTLSGQLFFRQLLHAQIGFQRTSSTGFLREAALLAQQKIDHPLRILFEKKTNISVVNFLDLSLATYAAILDKKYLLDTGWFDPLRKAYSDTDIQAFISAISRNIDELVTFCRSLPNSNNKVSSELYEFPVVSRYPFFRDGNIIKCWHPAVFYRGMENFVHSVLSEEGQDYMDRFSKRFERHVISEAKTLHVPFLDENTLQGYVPTGTKVPDGLFSFPNCNIFIESKAGLFDESVMTVGHSEMFSHKTKALRTAVSQAWSASVSLRHEKRAPPNILNAEKDYLLIVTNKELSASNGTKLALMYPQGTLDYQNPECSRFLPLDHIYVLSIDDFERLISGAVDFNLAFFLAECVEADRKPDTAVHFFEQHLDKRKIPRRFSRLVSNAFDDANSRIQHALT